MNLEVYNDLKEIKKYNFIKKPLILDGSIGNFLEINYPNLVSVNTWTNVFNHPQHNHKLISLYHKYLVIGVDIISTNTFRTNPIACDNDNGDYLNEVKLAVETAKQALLSFNNHKREQSNNLKDLKKILIAGCNPPAEDCYKIRSISYERVKDNHINHIEALFNNNVDFILNETLSHMDEIDIIAKYCSSTNKRFALSLYFPKNIEFKLLDNTLVYDAIKYLDNNFKAEFISLNCIGIDSLNDLFNTIKPEKLFINNNWGLYLNNFANFESFEWKKLFTHFKNCQPSIIGGCCYTYPDDIERLSLICQNIN